ncbi:MAG: hypothetical protein WA982_02855, partial [Rubrobacteraceae bacterium]
METGHTSLRNSANPWRSMVVVIAALLSTLCLLLWLPPDARGEATTEKVDETPGGQSYAAGELLVAYEETASEQVEKEVSEEAGAKIEENLKKLDAQLLAFPEVKKERSGEEREDVLAKKKVALEGEPGVASVEYNYVR